jgi:Xaa-Pro aminopeptidase
MPLNLLVFSERISRLRSQFSKLEITGILLLDMKNIRYLTGFAGSDGALCIDPRKTTLLVDGRYLTQAKNSTQEIEIYEYQDKMAGVASVLSGTGSKIIGFESQVMSVDTYGKLKKKLKGVTLKPLADRINSLRAVKDEQEVTFLKEAAAISFQALSSIEDMIRPGIEERHIAVELETKLRKFGAEEFSFSTIVASGPNSALPHAKPDSRRLERGDFVMIDYGAVVEGYHSDETCMFVVGQASDKQRKIYDLVKRAHDEALCEMKEGVLCRRIDDIARSYIEKGGFGAHFLHGTGHGVGLDVHEAPRLAKQSEDILTAGMVVTVEPGIYISDIWGIRIEDTVLIKENGCEVLTKMSKDLRILS